MRRAIGMLIGGVMMITSGAKAQDSVKEWATTFVYGVVPAAVASAAAQCRDGLAKVRRGQTPANTLVSLVTLGMFNPITILVTCANPMDKPAIDVPADATMDERRNALADAVDESLKLHRPVVVRYTAG
jgi:Bor protein